MEYRTHRNTSEAASANDLAPLPPGDHLVIVCQWDGPIVSKKDGRAWMKLCFEEVVPLDEDRPPRGWTQMFLFNVATNDFARDRWGDVRWSQFTTPLYEGEKITDEAIRKTACWIQIEKGEKFSFIKAYAPPQTKDLKDIEDYRAVREEKLKIAF